ncbi:MAG: PilZ domain-containing protein [Candidatus Omnitrophota bacterium]
MNNDKRKSGRIKVHIPIRYRKLKDSDSVKEGFSISKDLGIGGIRFRITEFISMACKLIVEVEVPNLEKPLKAISKVVWIRKTNSPNEYEVGNQFIEMSREDKDLIAEYIDGHD